MKKFLVFLLILPFITSCDEGSFNNRNPYIPNYTVSLPINLNLPQYSNLQFPSNHIVDYSQGARGIVVFNTGSGFVAFDLACPNQELSSCSTMSISGINAICACDSAEYSLFSGQSPGLQYPMKQYRVQIQGSMLTVYN
jgi:nitrite reductase/ring-hydroxylating ferredoxin subunit